MESQDSKLIADGRAWSVDGRAQALVGPGLATPLSAWGNIITCCPKSLISVSLQLLA